MDERSTARPSARREYGVGPAPFNCSSKRSPDGITASPSRIARPSPKLPGPIAKLMPAVSRSVGLHPRQHAIARKCIHHRGGAHLGIAQFEQRRDVARIRDQPRRRNTRRGNARQNALRTCRE